MSKSKKGLAAVLLLALIVVLAGGYFWQQDSRINSFEDCKKAGYPIQESFPEVCQGPNNKGFTNSSQSSLKSSPKSQPQASGIMGHVQCIDKVNENPCATEIEISDNNGDQPNITVKTDASGYYKTGLPPSSYTLKPAAKTGYVQFLPPVPNPVEVKADQFTTVDVNYHDETR